MSQLSGNQFGEGVVRITANTEPLKEGLQEAKAQTEAFAAQTEISGEAAATSWAGAASGVGIYITAALAAAKAAIEAFDAIDDAIRGKSDFNTETPTGFAGQIRQIREEAKKLEEAAVDRGLFSRLRDVLDQTNMGDWRAGSVKAANDAQNEISRLENAQNQRRIEKERAAMLAKVEREAEVESASGDKLAQIEIRRKQEIADYSKKLTGDDLERAIAAVNTIYDAREKREIEAEAKKDEADKRQQEREEEAFRRKLEHQQKEYEDLERLLSNFNKLQSDAANRAADSLSKAADRFNSSFSAEKYTATLQQIANTLDAISRRRD